MQTQFTSPYAHKKIIPALNRDWDRKQAQDDKSTKALGFAPTADYPRWSFDQIAAAEFYLSQRDKGHKREMAGRLATRLHRAMQDHPTAEQFTVVTLANGSTSIGELQRAVLPSPALALATDPNIDTLAMFVEARTASLRARNGWPRTADQEWQDVNTAFDAVQAKLAARYLKIMRA